MSGSASNTESHRAWIRSARVQTDEADLRSAALVRGRCGPGDRLGAFSIPGYSLEREVHRGGQGTIFLAVQESTGRRVAIKLLHSSSFGGPLERARFERETRILAALRHPNIVGIHDGGGRDGQSYLVMDYIAGEPLDRFVAQRGLDIRAIVELVLPICEAVNAAHLRGIIHRDLKPANVRVDDTGRPFVLDFGLAKFSTGGSGEVGLDARVAAEMTQTGQFLGSLPWAAPEQADGSPSRIDTRTDVYSLGVLLYQLLTGKFPYAVVGNVRSVLDSIATAEPIPPRSHRPAIDDDLQTIVLKCLSKERERRYQTAGELGSDLRRYLKGEPIEAKGESSWYVLRKTIARHRWKVAATSALGATITIAAISLSVMYGRQGALLADVERERDKAITAERMSERRLAESEYEAFVANIAAASASIAANDGGAALTRLRRIPERLRHWEWRYLASEADQSEATWHGPAELIAGDIRFSPQDRFLAAWFWMEERPSALRVWPIGPGAGGVAAAYGRDCTRAFDFAAGRDELRVCEADGMIVSINLAGGGESSLTRVRATKDGYRPLCFLRNGRLLALARGGSLQILDIAEDRIVSELGRSASDSQGLISQNSCGDRFVLGLWNGYVEIGDISTGEIIASARVANSVIYGVALSEDGKYFASAEGEEGVLGIWELTRGDGEPGRRNDGTATPSALRLLRRVHPGGGRIGLIAFSPDGRRLAAPCSDKSVLVLSVPDLVVEQKLLGHSAVVTCVRFSVDGRRLASGAREGEVKLWDLERIRPVQVVRDLPNPVNALSYSRDGPTLLVECSKPLVLDSTSRRLVAAQPAANVRCHAAVWGPDPTEVTVCGVDGTVRSFGGGLPDGKLICSHPGAFRMAGDRAGRCLATASAAEVIVWKWGSGEEQLRLARRGIGIQSVALSEDGRRLALGSGDGRLEMVALADGSRHVIEQAHDAAIAGMAFSADGSRLATVSNDRTVSCWDATTGVRSWVASPQMGDVWCAAFSPDGGRLAVGGRDRTVRLFDSGNGRELVSLSGASGTVMCVAFSADGRTIAAGSWAREVVLWETGRAGLSGMLE